MYVKQLNLIKRSWSLGDMELCADEEDTSQDVQSDNHSGHDEDETLSTGTDSNEDLSVWVSHVIHCTRKPCVQPIGCWK